MKNRMLTIGATVLATLSSVGCGRITEPTMPASSSPVTSLPASSPASTVVHDGPPVAATLMGNNHLILRGSGWQELYSVSLLTEPTGGGVQSYVNIGIEAPWILRHTPRVVQLTNVNIILDAYGLLGSHTLISFLVSDQFGNLIQERVLDSPIVLR